jgi:3-phosphoshikimate 1-carboxyvinyltransferase
MIEIHAVQKAIDATVTVPGSKSYTNRALLVAALAEGRSRLTGALFSDDTRNMCEALRQLGVEIEADEKRTTFEITGKGGKIPVNHAELYIGNSGTTSRSLVSYVALGKGTFVIDGDEPMRRARPIANLLNALRQLGVDVRPQFDNGYLPVIVHANGFEGGKTRLNTNESSQFLTSLMLVAPYTRKGIEVEITDKLKTPYIDITLSVMKAFSVNVTHDNYRFFHIEGGQQYQPCQYTIESDASSASYFFAAAALTGGRVRIDNLSVDSVQGDVHFVDVLQKMGCQVNRYVDGCEVVGTKQLKGIDIDMNSISDTWPTLAVIAPFVDGKVSIRNIEHTRWQETDRIHATVTELRKLGVHVVEHKDGVEISPSRITPAAIDTYNDHRIAMSFSLIGLKVPGIRIKNPSCVNKTFPTYFDVLQTLK